MKSHYFSPPFLNFHVVTTVSAPLRNHEHVIPWILATWHYSNYMFQLILINQVNVISNIDWSPGNS